jgi:hypothetical protein
MLPALPRPAAPTPPGPRSPCRCGTIGGVPADEPTQPTETCPGCAAVLVRVADRGPAHPGASTSCSRLFEVTLRGLREEAAAHPVAASTVAVADAAYDAQHPADGEPDRLRAALDRLGVPAHVDRRDVPAIWRTTIADVAADLDVIDLTVLVQSWARTVQEDWAAGLVSRT